MNNVYSEFAYVYDLMQYDVDYDTWSEKIEKLIQKHRGGSRSVLELATGTGNMAIRLSKMGYVLEAVDLSGDMLTIAAQKTNEAKQKIKYYEQDMRSFLTRKKYDVILSVCDGMNYLVEESDFKATLDRIHEHLSPGGLVIFDLSSEYKLSEIIGNSTFAETFENSAYIWENEYDPESRRLNFLLTLFIESNGLYARHEEYHHQRAYTVEEVKTLTSDLFELLEVLDGDTFDPVNRTSNRICFVLKGK